MTCKIREILNNIHIWVYAYTRQCQWRLAESQAFFFFWEESGSQLGGPWTKKSIFFCNLKLITSNWEEATEPAAAGRNLADILRKWAPAHLLHVPLPGLPGRSVPFPIPTNAMLQKITKLPHTTRGIQGILKFYWKSKKKFYQNQGKKFLTNYHNEKNVEMQRKGVKKIILSL